MQQRIMIDDQPYKIRLGTDTNNCKLVDIQDIVEISFDRDNQEVNASIKNPSDHTKYLFNQGRLGIYLTRMLIGETDHWHMSNIPYQDGVWRKKRQDGSYHLKSPTRKQFYPKWSRIGQYPTKVDNLDSITIPIDPSDCKIRLPRWAYSYDKSYTIKVQAILCCIGVQDNIKTSPACRTYPTKSNTIRLRRHLDEGFGPAQIEVDEIIDLGDNEYEISLIVDGWIADALYNEELAVALKVYGPRWASGSRGQWSNSWNRGKYAYVPKQVSILQEKKYNSHHYGQVRWNTHQTIDSTTFNYQIPEGIYPYHTLWGMYRKHGDPISISGECSIVIINKSTGTVLCHVLDYIPYNYYYD